MHPSGSPMNRAGVLHRAYSGLAELRASTIEDTADCPTHVELLLFQAGVLCRYPGKPERSRYQTLSTTIGNSRRLVIQLASDPRRR